MSGDQNIKGKGISRRQFLATAGGAAFAITAYVAVPGLSMSRRLAEEAPEIQQVNAWVFIQGDGKITIYNPAAEMGQGSMTALPVIIAEEMDLNWADVNIEYSPIEPEIYGRGWGRGGNRNLTMLTVGSYSVRSYYDSLRKAGAQARYIMLYSAGSYWNVPVSELSTKPGIVMHSASGKQISYADLTSHLRQPDRLPEIGDDMLKSPDQFRLIGNAALPRFDIPDKVDGKAMYSLDIDLDDLHYAMMFRIPTNGRNPVLSNEREIMAMPGVIATVTLDHGIAVVANNISSVLRARDLMEVDYDAKEGHTSTGAYDEYGAIASDSSFESRIVAESGDLSQMDNAGYDVLTSDYYNDYVYHAQMEPLNAVVRLSSDATSAEVWAGTQGPSGARDDVANALGIPRANVKLYPQYLGGGFGRRSMSDNIVEAVQIAKEVGLPIKLIWSRQDDLQYGAFRPQSLQRMSAWLDDSGTVIGWRHTIVGTGERLLASGAAADYYHFPNKLVEIRSVDHNVRTKHWRAVGHGPNHFAIESFIDEIAEHRSRTPFEIRRSLLAGNTRCLNVLMRLEKMMDNSGPVPDGRARGIAFGERSGSLTAGGCELSYSSGTGKIKVHRFWAAVDAGVVIQPDNVVAQMEGAILMGMSSAMYESITFRDGKVEQSNFNDYQLLRMEDIPDNIEIEIIASNEHPSGVGEAGLPFVGAAISNAFASLTGTRLRHMPFTPDNIKRAIGD